MPRVDGNIVLEPLHRVTLYENRKDITHSLGFPICLPKTGIIEVW